MKSKFSPETVYARSDDVVARKIGHEIILIPVDTVTSEKKDKLFTLNSTAQAIWKKLNGKKDLKGVIADLSQEYDSPDLVISKDVITLVNELLRRKLIVKTSKTHVRRRN